MLHKTTHILVIFACAAALFLHSEGVPISVHPTLESICKGTKFPYECSDVINARVKGGKVDPLSALKEHTEGAIEAFKSAEAITATLGLKACSGSFTNALSKLQGTKQCIADRNGSDLKALLAAAATDVDTCIGALKNVPNADERTVEDTTYLRSIIANSLSLADQFISSVPAVKSTKPAATLAGQSSVSRPKPTSGARSVSRPKPTSGASSVSRPKPTSGASSVSRPKPTFAVRGSSRSRPAATLVDAGLSSICKQTMYPAVCASTIAPLLKGGKICAVSALKAEMQVALASFQQAKQLVEKAIAGGATSELNTCNENYESALSGLEKAQKAVAGGNNSVGLLLTAINTDAQTCLDTINDRPGTKSPAPTKTLEALVQISANCLDIMRQIRL